MLETIKKYASLAYGLLIVILGGLLVNRNRKLQQTESELAHEKTTTEIKLNDQAREAAKSNADELLANYERLKRDD
jgi:hypothetical protein